ncbi:DUF3780 domain-containing protein [Siccirubricoccus phaeus]|uniref:DUF3780 domain-containing protein n=1 Tax=Siccirubricoccus phaeus TaxID=2595053 RepID=UPI0011F139E2|nr:DUF3780 domain-containing protein [Siccirubricoccus phaeus]
MSKVPTRRRKPERADAAVVDARGAVSAAKRQAQSAAVTGFGCPVLDWPHHLKVLVPTGRTGEVTFVEDFGIVGHAAGRPDELERCRMSRAHWGTIAEPVKREFNERLRALDLPPGRWQAGENRVERMLGLELLALAWPVSAGDEADIPAILASWQALRPEERWWLAGRVAANPTPRVARGLAMLLSGGPAETGAGPRGPAPKHRESATSLPLFELPLPAA